MNQKSTWIVFATILIAAGMVGGFGLSKSFFVGTESVKPIANAGFITGHIELIAKDKDGNIKAYRQTDNLITNKGQNCAAKALFSLLTVATGGSVNATRVCAGAVTSPFTVIAIGNSSATASKENIRLGTEWASGNGLNRGRIDTSITWTNSSASTSANGGSATIVLQRTFTVGNTPANTATMTESGLLNDTGISTGALFARQTFSGISLTTSGDALTVKWTIDIGGTAAFS